MDPYVVREPREFPVPSHMMNAYHANMQRNGVPIMMDGQVYQQASYGELGASTAAVVAGYNEFRELPGSPAMIRAPPQSHSLYVGSPHLLNMERPMPMAYSGGPSVYSDGYIEPRYIQTGNYNNNSSNIMTAPVPLAQNPKRKFSPHQVPNMGSKYEQRDLSAPERSAPVRPHLSLATMTTATITGGPAVAKSRPAPLAPAAAPVSTSGGAGTSSATPKDEPETKPKSRADKQKDLQQDGVRVFAGPVEKVIKWHKMMQDIGLMFLYEVVAKVVSVRPGQGCAKNILVRDEGGPVLQIVYYEIEFLLPDLQPNTTVRVVGKMAGGAACKLQAYSVRRASGDDVAALSRRAAVASHQLAKIHQHFNE